MKKTLLDDGSYPYLTEGAELIGKPGIPALLNIDNVQVPKSIIPFEKIRQTKNKRQYIHFYMHDKYFMKFLTSTNKYRGYDLLDKISDNDDFLEDWDDDCIPEYHRQIIEIK